MRSIICKKPIHIKSLHPNANGTKAVNHVVPPNFISNETLFAITSKCPAEPTHISELQLRSELSIQDFGECLQPVALLLWQNPYGTYYSPSKLLSLSIWLKSFACTKHTLLRNL